MQSGGEEVAEVAPRRNRVTLPALPSKLQSTLDLTHLQLNEVSKLSTMREGDETPIQDTLSPRTALKSKISMRSSTLKHTQTGGEITEVENDVVQDYKDTMKNLR